MQYSLAKLEKQGFEGHDADLETSLREYGLAWKKADGKVLFIHSINSENDRFSMWDLPANTKPSEEFCWVKDWKGVSEFCDQDMSTAPIEFVIPALVSYYGHECVYGSPYGDEGCELVD